MKALRPLRSLFRFLACLALFGALLLPLHATQAGLDAWTSNGPADNIGTVAVASANNQIVYATGQRGLWKSTDAGGSWSLVGSSKPGLYAPIAVDPRDPAVIYSSGTEAIRGVVKSTDGGVNWTVLQPNVDATSLMIDPTRPNVIYAGVVSGSSVQILKSVNDGASWAAVYGPISVSPGLPSVSGLAIDPASPDRIFAAFQLYHSGGVMRSDDAGGRWTTVDNGSRVPLMLPTALAISPNPPGASRVYVGWGLMGTKAFLTSSDYGSTWQNLTPSLPPGGGTITSLILPGNDNTIIASMAGVNAQTQVQGGVFVSRDGGQSWVPLAPLAQGANRLAWASATRTLYAGTTSGVWQYTVPESGLVQAVNVRFRAYYDSHDGWRVLGRPISYGTFVGNYFTQYFEKGRIEDHTGESSDPNWQFMYGLLVDELQQAGADVPVGGDTSTVSYATIKGQAAENLRVSPPPGYAGGTMPRSDGSVFVPFTADLSPAPGHNVFRPFWDYINRADLFPGGWLHDIGLPITEPMGAIVNKGDARGRQITIQAFQRTVLTYDPLNPPDWQVERANVGTDYRSAFPGRVPN